MPGAKLPQYKAGQRLGATGLNETNREVERLGNLRVSAPLEMVDTPSGPLLKLAVAPLQIALTGGSGIPAKSGTTPGGPTDVTIQRYNGSTMVAGEVVKALNYYSTAFAASKVIVIAFIDNHWFAINQEC